MNNVITQLFIGIWLFNCLVIILWVFINYFQEWKTLKGYIKSEEVNGFYL
jgi:hypothetical protein